MSLSQPFHHSLTTLHLIILQNVGKLYKEELDVLSNVKIFVLASKDLVNNSRFIEGALTRAEDSGLWIYEISSVAFNPDDNIEYWYYVEHHGLGYFSNQMNVNAGGEKFLVKNFSENFHHRN